MSIRRLVDRPIIDPSSHPSIGANIQGPSMIRVPDWVDDPLGRYYLYFADHKGTYIRLAFAEELCGPWTVHPAGSLQLSDTPFPSSVDATDQQIEEIERLVADALGPLAPRNTRADATAAHIASPDVHVRFDSEQIVMYFHGLESLAHQVSRVATSSDGLHFSVRSEVIGRTYFRAFDWAGWTYGLAMPGQFYRSADGLTGFEAGPRLFNPDMRHSAVRVVDSLLEVYWTQVGDAPERIYRSTIDLRSDWQRWEVSDPVEILRPERPWEGAGETIEPSFRSVAPGPVNQLRDPAIFEEDGRVYLLYATAGESGIGIAELT